MRCVESRATTKRRYSGEELHLTFSRSGNCWRPQGSREKVQDVSPLPPSICSDSVVVAAGIGSAALGAFDGDVEGLAAKLVLKRDAVGEGHAEAFYGGAAVGEHRLLAEGRDPLGQLQRPLQVAAGRDDLVDEADPVSLLGADRSAGEDQLQGAAQADDAGQPLRPAV